MAQYWDLLLSSPGLSHLATEIFLVVDLDTFFRLEQVCKAWKRHFEDYDLWKKKILQEATDKGIGKDDLAKLCHSLCHNRSWFTSSTRLCTNRNSRTTVAHEDSEFHIATLVEGRVLIVESNSLRMGRVLSPSDPRGERRSIQWEAQSKVFEDSYDQGYIRHKLFGKWVELDYEEITCVDVHGGGRSISVAVGCSRGSIRVWTYDCPTTPRDDGSVLGMIRRLWTDYWEIQTPLPTHIAEAERKCGRPVSSVKFGLSGDEIVSFSKPGSVATVWSFVNGKIALLHEIWLDRNLVGDISFVDLYEDRLVAAGRKGVATFSLYTFRGAGGEAQVSGEEAPSKTSCLLALRSVPGLAVTGERRVRSSQNSKPSLRVWDLDAPRLLHHLTELWGDPEGLSECPQAGILAISMYQERRERGRSFCTGGVMLLPTEGVRLGVFIGTFVEMYDGNTKVMRSAAISPAGVLHAVVLDGAGKSSYLETFTHSNAEVNPSKHRVVKKNVVRMVDDISDPK